jgi:hypothetical protein
MIELITQGGLSPFIAAGFLVVLLFVLEVTLMFMGLSSASETDAPSMDADADIDTGLGEMSAADITAEFNVDAELAAQIEAEVGIDSSDASDIGISEANLGSQTTAFGGVLDFLGIRRLPLTVWLALFTAGFASSGLAFQVALFSVFGVMLPANLASVAALVPATLIARGLSGWMSRLIPRDETSAISERSLGRRRGVVTVGTARRDQPAQVRITDHYGNTHYAMIEPFSDDVEIIEGTEVLVLRIRGGELRLVPLT